MLGYVPCIYIQYNICTQVYTYLESERERWLIMIMYVSNVTLPKNNIDA